MRKIVLTAMLVLALLGFSCQQSPYNFKAENADPELLISSNEAFSRGATDLTTDNKVFFVKREGTYPNEIITEVILEVSYGIIYSNEKYYYTVEADAYTKKTQTDGYPEPSIESRTINGGEIKIGYYDNYHNPIVKVFDIWSGSVEHQSPSYSRREYVPVPIYLSVRVDDFPYTHTFNLIDNLSLPEGKYYLQDVNGDNRSDLIVMDEIGIYSHIYTANGNGFSPDAKLLSTGELGGAYVHYFADINGDNIDDLIQISTSSEKGWIAIGNINGNYSLWDSEFYIGKADSEYRFHFADINGDGNDDMIRLSLTENSGNIALGQQNGTFKIWHSGLGIGEYDNRYEHQFADINGDGKDDLIQFQKYQSLGWIALGRDDGTLNTWNSSFNTGDLNHKYRYMFADINGDNRSDLIEFPILGVHGRVSHGTISGTLPMWSSNIGTGMQDNHYYHHIADINGDNKDDLIQFMTHSVYGWIGFGNSSGIFDIWTRTIDTGMQNYSYSHYFGDINGDGRDDMLQISNDSGKYWISYGRVDGYFPMWDFAM